MQPQLMPVPFYEDIMVLVNHEQQPFVAMKPVVENMGLDWKSQQVKLIEKFNSTRVIITSVAEDGKPRDMVCLPLRKLPAFLYSINPEKVKPALRDKIRRYQEECDEALWNYWSKGSAQQGSASQPDYSHLNYHRMASSLLSKLQKESNPESRRFIYQQLCQVSEKLNIQAPALAGIGKEASPDHASPLLEVFWEAFEFMQNKHTLNHSRNPQFIAINLLQMLEACAKEKIKAPDYMDLRRVLKASLAPKFVAIKTVNSQHQQTSIKCWVFETSSSEP